MPGSSRPIVPPPRSSSGETPSPGSPEGASHRRCRSSADSRPTRCCPPNSYVKGAVCPDDGITRNFRKSVSPILPENGLLAPSRPLLEGLRGAEEGFCGEIRRLRRRRTYPRTWHLVSTSSQTYPGTWYPVSHSPRFALFRIPHSPGTSSPSPHFVSHLVPPAHLVSRAPHPPSRHPRSC